MKKDDNSLYTVEAPFTVEFYDVDAMNVAWHGNYVKFIEVGRCALLDELGYGYKEMTKDKYAFPVTNLSIKYIRSLVFGEKATIKASLVEYEFCLKIKYEIFNEKGQLATRAETTQMALNMTTNQSEIGCPKRMLENIENKIKK